MNLKDTFKQKIAEYQADKAQKLADEEKRVSTILAGEIAPINVTVNLESDEIAYVELPTQIWANVEGIEEHSVGKSKKKGVVGRAIVGGVLLGPLGALGGAATAGSKHTTTTVQKTVVSLQNVDSGRLILTNKRVLFLGNNVMSIPYSEVIATSFGGNGRNGFSLALKRNNMLNGEFFALSGPSAKDGELYYRGITANLR